MELIKKETRKLKEADNEYGLKAVVIIWKIAEAGAVQTKRQSDKIPDVKSVLEM